MKNYFNFKDHSDLIDSVIRFSEAIWNVSYWQNSKIDMLKGLEKSVLDGYRPLNVKFLKKYFDQSEVFIEYISKLKNNYILSIGKGKFKFSFQLFSPIKLVNIITEKEGGSYEDNHYLIMRSLRNLYHFANTHRTVQVIHLFAKNVNQLLLKNKHEQIFNINEINEILRNIPPKLKHEINLEQQDIEFFWLFSRVLNYIKPATGEYINIRTLQFDPSYMLSKLFGLTSDIQGFNDIFGGGGIIFNEKLSHAPLPNPSPSSHHTFGRSVLIKGEFGTGKTTLLLQIAFDVANKGGVVWIMPIEQIPDEYLYVMQSMEMFKGKAKIKLATEVSLAAKLLKEKVPEEGLIIFLRSVYEPYESFLGLFVKSAEHLEKFPLSLISVDPLNSVIVENDIPEDKQRKMMFNMVSKVKSLGVNLILVQEDSGSDSKFRFEEKLVDTVIKLSEHQTCDYPIRNIEITKSRLQRSLRGRHQYSIAPGQGFRICPSLSAVRAKIKNGRFLSSNRFVNSKEFISFGHTEFDEALGLDTLESGDVIVLQGPRGTFKTQLGLCFLEGTKEVPRDSLRPISLAIVPRGNERLIREILENKKKLNSTEFNERKAEKLRIIPMSIGHLTPSAFFQNIEMEIDKAKKMNYAVKRVMVDNVIQWEMNCPLIRQETTFASTLVNYFRRYSITSLFICGDNQVNREYEDIAQRTIIDNANLLIKFYKEEINGIIKQFARIEGCRGKKFSKHYFEVDGSDGNFFWHAISEDDSKEIYRLRLGVSVRNLLRI